MERVRVRGRAGGAAGFTLLEVLVALTIVALAITTLLQLSSQGLRLLKLSGEHQQAVLLADRLAREAEPGAEEIRAGEEGPFAWERRVRLVPVARELTAPGGVVPMLFSVSVAVRWGQSRSVELATLKAAVPEPTAVTQPSAGQPAGPRAPASRQRGLRPVEPPRG